MIHQIVNIIPLLSIVSWVFNKLVNHRNFFHRQILLPPKKFLQINEYSDCFHSLEKVPCGLHLAEEVVSKIFCKGCTKKTKRS